MDFTSKRPIIPKVRGLPSTRRGALLLSVGCALMAAVILLVAINHYRHSVSTAGKQETVLVATGTIQKGTTGDVIAGQQLYKPTPILVRQQAAGAVTDASVLHGQVAVQDILPGQQLTASDFAPAAAGAIGQLAPTQRAISVSLDSAHGLTGLVQAGDRVDVYGDFNVQNLPGAGAGSANNTPVVRLLVPNALVLKVPDATNGSLNGGGQTQVVSLAVANNQVPTLTFAAENGKVWLALRPGNATAPSQGLTTLSSEIFGDQSHSLTASPAAGASGSGSPAPSGSGG